MNSGKIYITTDYPIPSCITHKLIWNVDKWLYQFEIKKPDEIDLPEENSEDNLIKLYVYGHIQQLKLVDYINKESINIEINSITDIKELLKSQALEDNEYREKWIEDNPDYYENITTLDMKNETQDFINSHIIKVLSQNKKETKFIVAY